MLALSRKVGQKIVIGDNIVITFIDIKGEHIRVGIEAPREIKIYRGELYDDIVAENKKAAAPTDFKGLEQLMTDHKK